MRLAHSVYIVFYVSIMSAVMSDPLTKEFEFFVKNQQKLARKYRGKYLVIRDESVWRAFGSELEALEAAQDRFEAGTFLIQKADPGEDAYTAVFHSRVSF